MVTMRPARSTSTGSGRARALLTMLTVTGLVAVFAATLLLEVDTGVFGALVASTVLVALYASAAGRLAGVAVALLALVAGIVSDRVAEVSLGPGVLVVYGLSVLALSVLVETLTRERVRTANELARLHGALGALTAEPALDPTLESVVSAARDTVGAAATAVFLVEGPVVTSPALPHEPDTARLVGIGRRMLASPSSPLGHALHRGVVVSVGDADPQFPVWTRDFGDFVEQAGVRSLVVVPLVHGGEPIGVLAAAFTDATPDPSAPWLLAAYGQQAGLVIARSQAYEHERRAAEALAATDKVKSEFLGMVSHELRTPLTAVKGFVDTVLYQWDRLADEQKRDLLGRASANADELTTLITELLDFTRLEGDLPPLDVGPVDLHGEVRVLMETLEPVLREHDVRVDMPPGLAVLADAGALAHVIGNLLTNAAKHTPAGTVVRVSARAGSDGASDGASDGEVLLTVADAGPGIAPGDRERIFERFYQAPGAQTSSRRGAGLGLSIAARYVELLGGRIWVVSEPGEGTSFHVALPRAPAIDPRGREAP